MMIDLRMDVQRLVQRLGLTEKQLGYVAVNALNATAQRVVDAEREHLRAAFILRKAEFMLRQVAILKKASARDARPYAEIRVGTKLDTHKGGELLLASFEAGGARVPFTPGAKSVAVPLTGRPARPSISGPINPAYSFAGMHLVAYFRGKRLTKKRRGRKVVDVGLFGEYGRVSLPTPEASSSSIQWRGKNRTFLLPSTRKEPFGGVFQRIGTGRGDIREIWAFRRGLHLDDRLHFVDIAARIADEWLAEDMEHQVVDSVAHNAGKA